MGTPGSVAGNTATGDGVARATGDGVARGRPSTWRHRVLYTAPVVVIALYGAVWITLHAGSGRGSAHTLFQSLALAEATLALLLRRRKPVGALAGILAVYLLFALDPLLLPAVLFALFTVAAVRDYRTTAIAAATTMAALAVMPYLRGDPVSFTGYSLPRLAAACAVVAAGTYLRTRREPAGRRTRAQHRAGEHGACEMPAGPATPGGPG